MIEDPKPEGAFFSWKWEDRDIDNPNILRRKLLEISSNGFSGLHVSLGNTRYEFIDLKVLRAVARVSLWAKKRNMTFYLHADPRQASRSFITRTGERMQNLIVTRKPNHRFSRAKLNVARVEDSRFELRYDIPRALHSSALQERALLFEPDCLEKAFLFQRKKGTALKDTIRDITHVSRLFSDLSKGVTEIFGDVRVPEGEEWWVIAFPKFNTNAFDFAGRESNDLMDLFIEDLFDACTHLDGITWGDGGAGYIANMGRFPVSLSLFNSFKAEYRYDLRSELYALVLDIDDASHVRIRHDYFSLLADTLFTAQKDFHLMLHSYFPGADFGFQIFCNAENAPADCLVQGSIDPWRSLESASSVIIDMRHHHNPAQDFESIISTLVISKSLGTFSKSQKAFVSLGNENNDQEVLDSLIDLMMLFSIQWLAQPWPEGNAVEQDAKQTPDWTHISALNRKIDLIRSLTGFRFPTADVALVFPTDTIMTIGSHDADPIIREVNQLIARLTLEGIQCDVISPSLLRECRFTTDELQIRHRTYRAVIYPYPEILDPKVLEIISAMAKRDFPILLGGCDPQFTTIGKRIPYILPLVFNPAAKDISALREKGIKPIFEAPGNSLTTLIPMGEETIILLCPKTYKGVVEGNLRIGEHKVTVEKSSCLMIFRQKKDGKIDRLL
ncbi:MAG: hypothetical protein ABIL68_11245 [bacterium]